MPRRLLRWIFLSLSLACFAAAAVLAWRQAQLYQASRAVLPPGSAVAQIPSAGLTLEEAGNRVARAFALTPVELRIGAAAVQIDPAGAGLELKLSDMLAGAQSALAAGSSWQGYWDFLLNRQPAPVDAPLQCAVNQAQLLAYLQNLLGDRYDQPATAARPIPGDVLYAPGQPGSTLNLEEALPRVAAALCSRAERAAAVNSDPTPPLPPDPRLLDPQLEALVQGSAFDGILEVYFQDLQTGAEINFAYAETQPVPPGIAFTAASTIKIPVMVSVYKTVDGPLPADLRTLMSQMIDLSDNASTDAVMQRVLDPNLAPLQVTADAQALGLSNTFLAGLFYPGAPLLQIFDTPANRRPDVSTDPDIYNQTSPADMGRLLAGIQRCANQTGGILSQVFATQITPAECSEMLDFLSRNKKGVLIENGLPEGTRMARKYGWVTDPLDGLMHSASDAALVYTPGGDFVMTVYFYHVEQLNWDAAQRLSARLATAVDNYYNNANPR